MFIRKFIDLQNIFGVLVYLQILRDFKTSKDNNIFLLYNKVKCVEKNRQCLQ